MPNLKELAGAMRQGLDLAQQAGKHKAWNMRTLANDLQLVLACEGDSWRLAMRREGVPPSQDEIDSVREAFDVPDAAARFDNMQSEPNSKTQRKVRYFRVELLWREQIAAQSPYLPIAASTFMPPEGPDA